LLERDTKPFITILDSFFSIRATWSQVTTTEATLQVVVELLVSETRCHVPQLAVVVNGKKEHNSGRYGFANLFIVSGLHDRHGSQYPLLVLELKDIRLTSLWNGIHGRFWANLELDDLHLLHWKLKTQTEKELLTQKHIYWDGDKDRSVMETLAQTRDTVLKQVWRYLDTICMGGVLGKLDTGILDR